MKNPWYSYLKSKNQSKKQSKNLSQEKVPQEMAIALNSQCKHKRKKRAEVSKRQTDSSLHSMEKTIESPTDVPRSARSDMRVAPLAPPPASNSWNTKYRNGILIEATKCVHLSIRNYFSFKRWNVNKIWKSKQVAEWSCGVMYLVMSTSPITVDIKPGHHVFLLVSG